VGGRERGREGGGNGMRKRVGGEKGPREHADDALVPAGGMEGGRVKERGGGGGE